MNSLPIKNGFLLWLASLLMVTMHQPIKAADAFEQNHRLGRGVNILGYDPIWRSLDRGRFKVQYFELLKDAGFQTVRVNLYPFKAMDPKKDWAISEQWWKTLDWVVREATQRQLNVILDFHEYEVMGRNPAGHHDAFLAFWRQLAAHCQNAADNVYFEILNEPNKKLTAELWNQYLREALAIIREKNPTRMVIIGGADWNSVEGLTDLKLPEGDRNLIVTVHYYEPMEFTHQGAPFEKEYTNTTGVKWLGTEKERAVIDKDFDQANAWATAHHRPIFLGEFGAYDLAPMESRVRFTSAIARAAEARGWSWAYWQFDDDFILYDIPNNHWIEPILDALIPGEQASQ